MTIRLVDARDRAEWLQCLQAAASLVASEEKLTTYVAAVADELYEHFCKRCKR